jgi:hypothetical protein
LSVPTVSPAAPPLPVPGSLTSGATVQLRGNRRARRGNGIGPARDRRETAGHAGEARAEADQRSDRDRDREHSHAGQTAWHDPLAPPRK